MIQRGQHPYAKAVPINARRECNGGEPLQLRAIARHVAKAVRRAITADGGVWRLPDASREVTFEDLWLVELQHVSSGSWQPVLAFQDVATF